VIKIDDIQQLLHQFLEACFAASTAALFETIPARKISLPLREFAEYHPSKFPIPI
jgi:hypothetical protein